MESTKKRLEKIRGLFRKLEIDALFVSKTENVFYLSGFRGDVGCLLITPHEAIVLTDFRYQEQVQRESPDFNSFIWETSPYELLLKICKKLSLESIGFESHALTYKQYQVLESKKQRLLGEKISFKPLTSVVEGLRIVKNEEEISRIQKATELADGTFSHLLSLVKPGTTEKELAIEIDFLMQRAGADKPSFDTIVASGINSSMPHARSTNRKIQAGDLIKMDFGAVFEGYHSDMTRTVVLGKASSEQKRIYQIVLDAQNLALNSVCSGFSADKVDRIARDYLIEKGFEKEFGHNLGHGVGLEVHEAPVLGRKSKDILKDGMVFTVEPGIYIQGFGGIRIEDLVALKAGETEVLTKSPKDLIEL